jgi:hypothetical protein
MFKEIVKSRWIMTGIFLVIAVLCFMADTTLGLLTAPIVFATASISFNSNTSAYQEAGSRYGWLEVVNADGTVPVGETFVRLPGIGKGKYDAGSCDSKAVMAADKKAFTYVDGELTGGFEFDLLASDIALIKFLSQTVKGKYFRAVLPIGISNFDTGSSKNLHGFIFYALGRIVQNGEFETPDGRMLKMKFNALPAPSATTITDADLLAETETLCELDNTAFLALSVTCAVNQLSEPFTCKMTY